MTADDREIRFGEVRAAPCERRLRPDGDRQFRVAACGCPADEDLTIFVDLDALRDLESHALSDTRLELGGVMLGGQYEDDQGRPFVVIADTLRAQHHESTAGSFKFTHETWAEFTRQRAALSDDLQIVGWYHTHPNLGVFLSELDRFICEHFFGRPADVALVLDPCQGRRGFFQWTREESDQIRCTGGFYLFTSRFRERELSSFVASLDSGMMGADASGPGAAPFSKLPFPAMPAPDTGPRRFGLGFTVLGVLLAMFLLLTLLGWKMLAPEPGGPADAVAVAGDWMRQPDSWGLAGVGVLVVGTCVWTALAAWKRRRVAPAARQTGLATNPGPTPETDSRADQTAIR